MPIRLFAGLGNPEDKFKNTRHNFGFEVLDFIAQSKKLNFKNFDDMAGVSIYEHSLGKTYLLKPLTFMNNSGHPLSTFMHYYKITPDELFIFYDDFAIDLGQYRVRLSGSPAGHNGIKSIVNHLNTQNFARMKLGIGPFNNKTPMPDFVLSKFKSEDKTQINQILSIALNLFDDINLSGLQKAISKLPSTKDR
jgi:PTH1 family peptidyl-tRNA hydrolase